MRICIDDYAYEVTKVLGSEACSDGLWGYMVYKLRPTEVLLSHGETSPSREHAERNARQLIALYLAIDQMKAGELSA